MGWKDALGFILPTYFYTTRAVYNVYRAFVPHHPGPTQFAEPELQDKLVNTADFGVPIPLVFGKNKVAATIIYAPEEFFEYDTREEINNSVAIVYHYRVNIAFKLCKGPIIGVRRIWLDDKLIFDVRDASSGVFGDGIAGYSTSAVDGHLTFTRAVSDAREASPETWRIYHGTATQMPDALLEEELGAGNVNAHRGDVYITIKNLLLNPFFKRVPNLTAEVVSVGSVIDSVYGPTTLSNFTLDTGEAVLTTSNYSSGYDQSTGKVIFLLTTDISGSGSTFYDGYQIEAFDPISRAQVFNTSVSEIREGGLWELDQVNQVVWIKDYAGMACISTINGQLLKSWTLASPGYNNTFDANGIIYAPGSGQVWYIHGQRIRVMSAASLLGSGHPDTPDYSLIQSGWINFEGGYLKDIPHKGWIIGHQGTQTIPAAIYDYSRNLIASPILSSVGYEPDLSGGRVDATNDCIWMIANARYLTRFNLASFSFTVVSDLTNGAIGASSTALIGYSQALACVVVYNDVVDQIQFIDISGSVINSIDYAGYRTTYGSPKGIDYVDYLQTLIVRAQARVVLWFELGRLSSESTDAATIVESICNAVGVSSADIAVSSVSTAAIDGYAIDVRTSAMQAIEPLQRMAFFDLMQENGKITAKKRGGSSVMTIDYSELGMDDSEEQKRPYEYTRGDEIEIPYRHEVTYSDFALDYESGLQSATRHIVRSKSIDSQTIPVLMSAAQAAQASEVGLWMQWAQRTGIRLNGTRKHWKLRAGDPFVFTDEGGRAHNLLATKVEVTGMTGCVIDAIFENASVYTNAANGADAAWTTAVIAPTLTKRFELLDIPIIKDSDNYQGFYVVAASGAPSVYLHESVDGGLTYTNKGEVVEAALGYTSTALADFTAGNVWDDVSTVNVVLYSGSIFSATDAQVLAGVNMFLVGNEIIQAATVTSTGVNTYALSRLLRGRKGTEWAISLHSSGERFVPLSTTTQRISSTIRGSVVYYKVAEQGLSVASAPLVAFTNTQAGMKPYSPVNIAGARDGSNNLTITWARRSRIGTAWGVTDALPLDDTVESYQVDIMSGSIVKRTISSTSPTCSYSAADQTTDFGGVQLSLLVNVYQMSTIVGRGTVGAKTI